MPLQWVVGGEVIFVIKHELCNRTLGRHDPEIRIFLRCFHDSYDQNVKCKIIRNVIKAWFSWFWKTTEDAEISADRTLETYLSAPLCLVGVPSDVSCHLLNNLRSRYN